MLIRKPILTVFLAGLLCAPCAGQLRHKWIPRFKTRDISDLRVNHTLSLNAGMSLVHYLVAFKETKYSERLDLYLPAIQVRYDQALKVKKVPVSRVEWGGMASVEYLRKRNPSHFYWYNGNKIYENYTDWFVRYDASASIRYLYVKRKHFEMFSGFRLGLIYWSYQNNSNDTDAGYYYKDLYKLETGFSDLRFLHRNELVLHGQLQLVGARVLFTRKWGMNAEVCLGAPHFASAGFCYRW